MTSAAAVTSKAADVVGSLNYTNGNGQNDSVIVLSIGKDITNMISKAPPTPPPTTTVTPAP